MKTSNSEITLSEKRKKLLKQFISGKPVKQKDTLNFIFQIIEEQDKEFIKRLKEKIKPIIENECKGKQANCYIIKKGCFMEIDKLAGDKLC